MKFDINQTEFPSPKHKSIWDLWRQIVPLDISLADISDHEMREGCTQIYNWTQEYLEAMYNNPDKYRKGIDFSAYELDNIIDDERVDLIQKYPLFCKYYKLFLDASTNRKVNRDSYVTYRDFRIFATKYKRSIDDLLRVLPDKLKGYALEMHEYVLSKGVKLESHIYYSRFRYKHKKQSILSLSKNSWRGVPLDIAVPYNKFSTFMQMVDLQADHKELTSYIQKEICACDACAGAKNVNKRCSKRWVEINGKKRLLASCHSDISKWKAPKSNLAYTDYDIKMLKRLVDIRFDQVNGLH